MDEGSPDSEMEKEAHRKAHKGQKQKLQGTSEQARQQWMKNETRYYFKAVN